MLNRLLDTLRPFLPSQLPGLPLPSLGVASVTERSIGLGNRRGNETRGGFTVVALRGGRLDTVVRFQVWGNQPSDVETALTTLHNNLETAALTLRTQGILRIAVQSTAIAEFNSSLNAWSGTTDYQVLYEFQFDDAEGADSLIARIPVDSEFGEKTVVTDQFVRWDNQTTPILEVRGLGFQVGALSMLAFLPAGWNGNSVMLSTRVQGIEQTQIFSSVRSFLNEFLPDSKTVVLGGNVYQGGRWNFPNSIFSNPIILYRGDDFFRVTYSDSKFDNPAILYLRVLN